MIAQWAMFALCALGFVRWFRKPDDPLTGLVGVSALGIFISVPFLPPTDAYRMRPYAVSIIIFGLLPALGLRFGMEMLKLPPLMKSDDTSTRSGALVIFTALLVATALLGSLLVKGFGEPPPLEQVGCPTGLNLISIRYDRGTYFNILREKAPGLDWMPNFHIGRFKLNAHSLPDPAMINWAEDRAPLTSMFYTLDYRSSQKVLVVARTALLPAPDSLWQVCGEWEDEPALEIYNIFYPREEASP
jgi:hypothetical protein